VKRERLDFLADNPLYTKRFAYYVGRRCRSATITDVAAELKLDRHAVNALDQQYTEAQLNVVQACEWPEGKTCRDTLRNFGALSANSYAFPERVSRLPRAMRPMV
jgi:hypothetical protein